MTEPNIISPPKTSLRFLRWFCDRELLEDVEGDLLELFHERSQEDYKMARRQFTKDVILLFRPGIIRNFKLNFNSHLMLKNYIITAFRSARKYKGHTLLNLLSLIVGVASCLVILLWIQDEIGMDKFHKKDDRLYRVWRNMHQSSGEILTTGAIPQPFSETLKNDYPEVDEVTLISWDIEMLFRKDDAVSNEIGKYVSSEFLSIFSFPLLAGNPHTALQDITSVIITERLAIKYFGNKWKGDGQIIDQVLTIGDARKDYKVSGVIQNPGPNSTLDFDWLILADDYIQQNDWVTSWYNGGFSICFALREGAEVEPLQNSVVQTINENTNYDADERIFINKYSDNYLYSTFENGRPTTGRIQYVKILFIISIFILVIACINFMNLATARSSRRTKEVGVRKVLGAQRGSLRFQFFVESFLMSLIAVLIAVLLVFIVLPYFNNITDKTLALNFGDEHLWIALGLVTVVAGLLSGTYPAILIPSFNIISSLKGKTFQANSGIKLREGLVVFQFTLSILLIIGTLVVSRQMDYILNKNLGLDKENIVFINMGGALRGQNELYKTELLKIPEIAAVTATSGNPLSYGRSSGSAQWPGKDPNEEIEINVLSVDVDFVRTMKAQIIKGRDFSENFSTDTANYLINEVTANIMGFNNPVDQDLTLWGMTGKVIGVVKNFHMSSMYDPIEPLIIRYDPSSTFVSFIRTRGNIPKALEAIEKVTAELNPDYPFSYEFLDQSYSASYRSEMTLSTIAKIFAVISIFIACLGLFGLSSYSAEQRSKEIGIRKVYGASVMNIVYLLSWGYSKLIVIAFILATPMAYYVMAQWLNNFVFRADIGITVFIFAGITTFIIGACTVGIKSWQAALMNPINTLKEE